MADRDMFLKSIDYPDHTIYGNIDHFFVPPVGFDKAVAVFREHHVIFLIGPHGCGKTFMAVKLMWDLFQESITPTWVKKNMIDYDKVQWELRSNPASLLVPNSVLYVEDPFGKVQYGWDQWFEVGSLYDLIKFCSSEDAREKNAYLILTSNQDIYHLFEKTIWAEDLRFLNDHANFYTPTYDKAGEGEILQRWANHFGCQWLDQPGRRDALYSLLKESHTHLLPLGLKDLAFFSSRLGGDTPPEILLHAISEDLWHGIAVGFAALPWIEKAFLARFFISPRIVRKRAGVCLNQFSTKINPSHAVPLETFLPKFKDVFLNYYPEDTLEFTCPGHFEVFGSLLEVSPEFADIFNHWVPFLVAHNVGIINLIWTIIRNYNVLPPAIHQVLHQYPTKEIPSDHLAVPIMLNYGSLPEEIRNRLRELVRDLPPPDEHNYNPAARWMAATLNRVFPILPSDVREDILKALSHVPDSWDVPWTALYYFNLLSPATQQLPFQLINDPSFESWLVPAIGAMFQKLPPEVQSLAWDVVHRGGDSQGLLAGSLFSNYENLPPAARELLVDLARRNHLNAHLEFDRRTDWKKVPPDDLDHLLRTAGDHAAPVPGIATFIINHYNELPESTCSLLFALLDMDSLRQKVDSTPVEEIRPQVPPSDRRVRMPHPFWGLLAWPVSLAILHHATELPKKVLEILLTFARDPNILPHLHISPENLGTLPEDIQSELHTLFAKRDRHRILFGGGELEEKFGKTPPDQQLLLLQQELGRKDARFDFEPKQNIVNILVNHFDSLGPDIKAMLFTLARADQGGYWLGAAVLRGSCHISPELLDLFIEVVDNPHTLSLLGAQLISRYNDLPPAAQTLVFHIPLQGRVPFQLADKILQQYDHLPEDVRGILNRLAQENPSHLASGILSHYYSVPQTFRDLLPQLFDRAQDTEYLARHLSSAISMRTIPLKHPPELPRETKPDWRDKVRKSERRLKQEEESLERIRKLTEQREKEHANRCLPAEVERHLLDILFARHEIRGLINLIAENYPYLDADFQQYFSRWAQDDAWAGAVSRAIASHYQDLPEDVQNLYRTIVSSHATDPDVVTGLVYSYHRLPKDLQQFVFTLKNEPLVQGDLALCIASCAPHLPDDVIALLDSLLPALFTRLDALFSKEEKPVRWGGIGQFLWGDTRMPVAREKLLAFLKASPRACVQEWLARLEDLHKRKASG